MNGDGYLDIVVPSWGGAMVMVFFGDGEGSVTGTRLDLTMGSGTNSTALADLNLDGALDIIAANGLGATSASIRLGYGDGTFRPAYEQLLGFGVTNVAVVDVNADGRPDLLGSGNDTLGNSAILYRTGNGDGTFNAETVLPTDRGSGELEAADLDQDGSMDLVVALYATDRINIYYGQTTGTPGARTAVPGVEADALWFAHNIPKLADANRDGYPDIFATVRSNVLYFQSSPMNDYGAGVAYDQGWNISAVELPDLNGDGAADMVSVDAVFNEVTVRLNDGFGQYNAPTSYAVGTNPRNVAVGDLNADGFVDTVVANAGSDNVTIRRGNGTGALLTATTVAVGDSPEQAVLADIDVDGDLDILTANYGTSNISVLRNNGTGTFSAAVSSACGDLPRSLAVGDLNRDGTPDLVGAGGYSGQETAWVILGNGTATLAAPTYLQMGDTEYHVALWDLNGDGNLDLVSANQSSDSDVGVRMGRGNGTFGELARYPAVMSPNGVSFADVNRDGAPEIFTGSMSSASTERWMLPTPSPWTQELTDMPAASLAVLPGANTFTVSQAAQYVDQLGVRVRLTDLSASLQNVSVSLTAPSGTTVVLDNGMPHLNQSTWQASYPNPWTIGNLSTLHGWQPDGSWTLTVTNYGTQPVVLEDFAVITRGWFQRPAVGTTAANAERLTFRTGTRWKRLSSTTIGATDSTTLSCATTTLGAANGPGERWFELVVPATNTIQELSVIGNFDAVIEVRRGTCATATAVLACNDNGAWGGRNPRYTTAIATTAGTYCIVVDGRAPGGGISNSGDFDLYVRMASNL
jgi:subtilisin-like proprotein convertase family protein